jgi:hypothetical protein
VVSKAVLRYALGSLIRALVEVAFFDILVFIGALIDLVFTLVTLEHNWNRTTLYGMVE